MHGDGKSVYGVLIGKPEGKRPLGRPRRSWEYNIRMDLRKRWIAGANWIHLAQNWVKLRACLNTEI